MDDKEIDVLLNVYERAQDNAQYHNSILWEATAIIWSGNALLMGFILEAVSSTKLRVHLLIAVCSLLGIGMTVFLSFFSKKTWRVERICYENCQTIEEKLQMEFKVHSKIKKEFEHAKIRMRDLYRILSVLFGGAWLVFLFVSLRQICRIYDSF